MENYFSIEQIDHRAMSAKAEIQQIRRKFFTLSIIVSAFLAYIWRFIFDFKMFSTLFVIPLSLNGLTWLLIVALSIQRLIGIRIRTDHRRSEFDYEGVIDEYRAYQFYLKKLSWYETVFDILIGLQFLFLVICFFASYYRVW